jgi:hypothetical protein
MNTAVSVEPRIAKVEVSDELITAYLVDGRVISVPLAWSWRLSEASPAQCRNWQLIAGGHGVHWPDVDEDLSAEGMLHGIPARPPARRSTARARLVKTSRRAKPKTMSVSRTRHAGGR